MHIPINTLRCDICTSVADHVHPPQYGWIGVDLDSTLAEDREPRLSIYDIGAPIPAMVDRVKRWLLQGYEVRIFTARASPDPRFPYDVKKVIHLIEQWSLTHIGTRLQVTNIKDHGLIAFWDDRAVRVEKDTGVIAKQC